MAMLAQGWGLLMDLGADWLPGGGGGAGGGREGGGAGADDIGDDVTGTWPAQKTTS